MRAVLTFATFYGPGKARRRVRDRQYRDTTACLDQLACTETPQSGFAPTLVRRLMRPRAPRRCYGARTVAPEMCRSGFRTWSILRLDGTFSE